MLLVLLAAAALVPPEPIAGRATVIDGDTIEIHGQRIRLWGIDAPEGRQICTRAGQSYRCGQEAANALDAFITAYGGTVSCTPVGRPDRYRRIVARCTINVHAFAGPDEDRDIAVELVSQGWALDYPRYSTGTYAIAQGEAAERKAGLWAGEFEQPWEWRAR